ncbi:hypothetical protein KY311_03795 [Candidatus Woesearchaeota archaeon]|nr:hypothetical protein [Candidatus Woesearchaeota archaeon]
MVPWYMVTFEEFDFHTGETTPGMKIMNAENEKMVNDAMSAHLRKLSDIGKMAGNQKITKLSLQAIIDGVEELLDEN